MHRNSSVQEAIVHLRRAERRASRLENLLRAAQAKAEREHGPRPQGKAGKQWDRRAGITALRRQTDQAAAAVAKADLTVFGSRPSTLRDAGELIGFLAHHLRCFQPRPEMIAALRRTSRAMTA